MKRAEMEKLAKSLRGDLEKAVIARGADFAGQIVGFRLHDVGSTPRKCQAHIDRMAIGDLYTADAMGRVNKSAPIPACVECAERGGYKGKAA
jgi:hypothetical protein